MYVDPNFVTVHLHFQGFHQITRVETFLTGLLLALRMMRALEIIGQFQEQQHRQHTNTRTQHDILQASSRDFCILLLMC